VCLWVPSGIVDVVGEVGVLGALEREFGCQRGDSFEIPMRGSNGRLIPQGRVSRSDQNSHQNTLFHRCPTHITQIGVDANVRRGIRRGSRGADHRVRVAPRELRLVAFHTFP